VEASTNHQVGVKLAAPLAFQTYVAAHVLGQIPWKRRYLRLFGPKVAAAAVVVATLKAIFLMAASLGRSMPRFVGPILKASSQPGGRGYAFGLERALELMDGVSGDPRSYADLFPLDGELLQDIDAWRSKVLPFDFSFMLAQLRVVEGLVFGEQHPELTRQLLETDIAEALAGKGHPRPGSVGFVGPGIQKVASAHGIKFFGAPWERIEHVHDLAAEFFAQWLDDAGLTPQRFSEFMDQ